VDLLSTSGQVGHTRYGESILTRSERHCSQTHEYIQTKRFKSTRQQEIIEYQLVVRNVHLHRHTCDGRGIQKR
jgi:hypothetical protein